MGGNRNRDHPQSVQQRRAIPQSRLRRDSSLYTREPLGTEDADCRVGPLGLLGMTVVFCHSEASAYTDRGNPSFLRWTMGEGSGRRGRRPLRKVYRSPSNGPMYPRHGLRRPNFLPKFGASVRSSAPTESPSQPARSEASAPAAARDGRESAQRPSQKGDRPRDCHGSA